jgi:porin
VKIGLYDLNSEFDVIEAAALFLNPSHGIGPDFAQSGRNGPSIFPVTSLAIRGEYRLATRGWCARSCLTPCRAIPTAEAHGHRPRRERGRAWRGRAELLG